MDISSLPDEMLTLILKKNSFATNLRLRKMNTRIATLARRTEYLTRVPVEKFKLNKSTVHVVIGEIDAVELGIAEGRNDFFLNHVENNVDVLRIWLPRIFLCDTLVHIDISEEIFDFFSKNRNHMRHLTCLYLRDLHFEVPIVPFITKLCPKLVYLSFFDCNSDLMKNLFDNQEFRNRKWGLIIIHSSALLEDTFLLDVAPNCKELCFLTENNFTISGAIKMFKNCSSNKMQREQSIELGHLELGDVPVDRIKDFVKDEIPGARLTHNQRTKWYQLSYENEDKEIDMEFKINV